eukprot:gene16835-biopygen12758
MRKDLAGSGSGEGTGAGPDPLGPAPRQEWGGRGGGDRGANCAEEVRPGRAALRRDCCRALRRGAAHPAPSLQYLEGRERVGQRVNCVNDHREWVITCHTSDTSDTSDTDT